tara:strand:- start:5224 stop:5691 length:468 start_codon:yes stop_codon:yes gene_type:complete
MSDPILTVQILETYKSRLASITKANGYHSDAGAELYEGWLADAIADDARSNYPFIALQPGVDRRLSKSSGGRLRRQLELHVVVVDRVDDGITTELLQHSNDVIHAVADRNNLDYVDDLALDSEVGDIEYNIPEGGGGVAWAAIPITADYQLFLKP